MIRIRNIKLSLDCNNEENLKKEAEHILKNKINSFTIKKRSIDAREKSNIIYVYTIDVEVNDENKILKSNRNNNISIKPNEEYKIDITGKIKLTYQPIVIGLGPSGLFVAYILAKYGYKPIIFERGNSIEERVKDINHFWNDNILNPNSNIQFGEGGAGTFSDGKLTTRINDRRCTKVLEEFYNFGAPEEILY
ncbi:MAG TPA: FAD-dependent oxidoreductase, partial [Bacilli bacterium]|nr:FAD-dependent oxidoreductase [Bacilli bacterium]